jgi:spoIIIJ-associated protein
MEWIEVTARNLDDAVELALDRLGVVEDELEYEVLEEPRTGFLGRLKGTARIRARVKPLSREKPADRRRRRRGEHRGNGGREQKSRSAAPARVGSGATRTGGDDRAEGGNPSRSGSSSRRRSRGRRGSGGAASSTAATAVDAGNHEVDDVDGAGLTIEEQAGAATTFTEELVRAFGLDGAVAAEVVEDDIELRVDGTGLGVLVGPKGATLHALEELVRAVVQHAAGGQSARLHLDVGGYRQRRREALAAFVTQVAAEVRESGTERALEPMSPPDRKVVHDTVAELDGIETISVGEEPRRRVVIRPA